jgi:uncharacterized protein
MENNVIQFSEDQSKAKQTTFITNVYGWMTGALAITGFIAWYVSQNESVLMSVVPYFKMLLIGELLVVMGMSFLASRVSALMASILFAAYAILNGLTFGVIFSLFTGESIASTFFVTGGTFGAMSVYGYFTKKDLTTIGRILIMALIGLIIASVVNLIFYINSPAFYWITTYAGVLIFCGLTAYDTQKLKNIAGSINDEQTEQKASIFGALTLYLDFINLFLFLLRIFGRRR